MRRQPVSIYLPRHRPQPWHYRWAPFAGGIVAAAICVESIRPFFWTVRLIGRFLIAHFGGPQP